MSFYNRSPFHLIDDIFSLPATQNVVVVSDAQYKEYKAKQALDEIKVLENRAEHYEKSAVSLRETIASIRKEFDLIASEEQKELPN